MADEARLIIASATARVVIGGERQAVYILYLAPKRGKPLKLVFSEGGELLKITDGGEQVEDGTILGWEVLAQGFKPQLGGR